MSLGSRSAVSALMIALLLPAVLCSSAAGAEHDDLSVTSVSVIQVIPDPRGIIVNKSASIRVTVFNAFDELIRADLRVTFDFGRSSYLEIGPEGNGVPLVPGVNTIYLPGGNCTACPTVWDHGSYSFKWTEQGVDSGAKVEVDPYDEIDETDEANNEMGTDSPVNTWLSRDLRILVVPMKKLESLYLGGGYPAPLAFSLDEELQELLEMYPLADDGVEVVVAPTRFVTFDTSRMIPCESATLNLSAEARLLGYDRVVAVFERINYGLGQLYGSAVGVLNEPRDPVPLMVTVNGIAAREALLAHEMGHTYYLWHPHDIGIPVYNATKWSAGEREYGVEANTFMSYPNRLPGEVPETPRWIDVGRYQDRALSWIELDSETHDVDGTYEWNLYDQFALAPRGYGPVVIVIGSILKSGLLANPLPWYIIPNGIPEEQLVNQQWSAECYSVRMLDALRDELGTTLFNVSFTRATHYDELAEFYVEEDVECVDFAVNAPVPPGTRYVQLVGPSGNVLEERAVTPSAPSVSVLSPDGAEDIHIGQEHEISWTAEDLDGDDLSYFVSYSPDDGDTWIPIASNLTSESYVWNTTGVAPTDGCRVRVMASDGLNTGEDMSDAAFRMIDTIPPSTRIDLEGALGENGWYVSEVNVTLTASDNSRISRTEYSFDDSTWMTYSSTIRHPDEGNTTVRFRSIDLAGNIEPVKSSVVRIDTTVPALAITSPTSGSSVGEHAVFSWNATDDVSGIARCEVRVNSGTWLEVGDSRQWLPVDLAEGANIFEVRATDSAGNTVSASVEFSYEEPSGIELWVLALVAGAVIAAVAVGLLYWLKIRK